MSREAEVSGILSGKSPAGTAAAVIYIIAKNRKQKIIQKKIAKVASTTEVTIRKKYKELIERLNIKTLL